MNRPLITRAVAACYLLALALSGVFHHALHHCGEQAGHCTAHAGSAHSHEHDGHVHEGGEKSPPLPRPHEHDGDDCAVCRFLAPGVLTFSAEVPPRANRPELARAAVVTAPTTLLSGLPLARGPPAARGA